MKYISRDSAGGFDLSDYEEYLDEQRERLGRLIDGDELPSIERFSLSEPASLHDARVENLSIVTGEANGQSRIDLRLKGPYFDRYFDLRYERVISSNLVVPASEKDLLIHEVRIENELLAHDFLFDGGGRFQILCARLRFCETLASGAEMRDSDPI